MRERQFIRTGVCVVREVYASGKGRTYYKIWFNDKILEGLEESDIRILAASLEKAMEQASKLNGTEEGGEQ